MNRDGTPACISLFCGAGGLDAGFKQAGFRVGLAYDLNSASIRTHARNHRECSAIQADLSSIQPEEILERWQRHMGSTPLRGVIGGPPCQAFSRSNVHKKQGDPRALLAEHYASILKHLNKSIGLDFFLFENSAGLLAQNHSQQLARFRSLFEDAGFVLFEKKIDASEYSVPQRRPRLLIVGINRDRVGHVPPFDFPSPVRRVPRTVREAIGGLPEPTYFRRGLVANEISHHPNHWCMNPRSRKFKRGGLRPGDLRGRSFRTLEWDKPSWTVAYGHREVHVHPSCTRRLSVYEAMLLQGFPKNYELLGNLSDQIRLVSDAVPPPLAKAIAKKILIVLEAADASSHRFEQRKAL